MIKNVITKGTNNELYKRQINDEIICKFINYLDVKPKSITTYSRALKQFAKWLQINNISQPQREDILSYRDYLKATKKPSTVQGYIVAVRLLFNWLESEKIYPNVAQHIKGATISKEYKKDYLTSNQIKNVLSLIDKNTAQGKRDYALITLMVTCGLRDIEVYRANIEDIKTKGDNTVIYLQGKGRDEKAEYIQVPNVTERAIREYLKTRNVASNNEPLFTSMSNNSNNKRLSTRTISGIIKQRLINAGYESDRLTAHSLRHTAVTLSLINGQSIQEVQQFARHSNISTTMIYAHNLDKDKNQCSNSIANSIF